MQTPKPTGKPFAIPKTLIADAYRKVKANGGAAGVDGQSIAAFEENRKDNLYKLWNRLASGSYFPPPVKAVEIPKKGSSNTRILGIPTVADRIAQTAAAMMLEPEVEPVFHPDSYGYRPKRSAIDAVGTCRKRCFKYPWVIDLDIRAFFDTVDRERLLDMVSAYTDERWVLLYVQRWLDAPLQRGDGTTVERDRGTPQGSPISPLLANIYLHECFDTWMAENHPAVPFERYSDDVVVHATSERQAVRMKDRITTRLAEFGLEVHPDKTRIVYAKNDNRPRRDDAEVSFDFCGYTFRPRRARNSRGEHFTGFLPAVGTKAAKSMRAEMASWRLRQHSRWDLQELAEMINPIVSGWINYFRRFYPSKLVQVLTHINEHLLRWAMARYKRLRRSDRKALRWLISVSQRDPQLFAHWRFGALPQGRATRAG